MNRIRSVQTGKITAWYSHLERAPLDALNIAVRRAGLLASGLLQ